jgi:hypothetical protein
VTEQIIIPPTEREHALDRLRLFLYQCLPGKPLLVTVKQYRRDRTQSQNAALWGVAYPPLIEFTGYTKDELHEVMCRSFFGTTEKQLAGQTISRPCRTTTTDEAGHWDPIDTQEMRSFYEHVQRIGAEMGCYVPDPVSLGEVPWGDSGPGADSGSRSLRVPTAPARR